MRKRRNNLRHKRFHPLMPNPLKGFFVTVILLGAYLSGVLYKPPNTSLAYLQSELVNSTPAQNPQLMTHVNISENTSSMSQIQEISVGQRENNPTPIIDANSDAHQIGPHTWTVTVTPDRTEATAQQIFQALNAYRTQFSVGQLVWNADLAAYAQSRAQYYVSLGKLDDHIGFINFLNNEDGFQKLGFDSVGENASLGFILTGTHLIGEVYAADAEHNANQLNPQWTEVGVGVSKNATDLVFGGQEL